ncbi:hypothetical protein CEXT_141561 [Caerostris extrusa]|uniref:Uncharacterized protein n=1 Tax=Caerostris extrusa TaxID=172846 RepID=A0AAV4XV52_CAEEX|nr:hypothetical protein CEXT_141561 [Caerostris extrusa]
MIVPSHALCINLFFWSSSTQSGFECPFHFDSSLSRPSLKTKAVLIHGKRTFPCMFSMVGLVLLLCTMTQSIKFSSNAIEMTFIFPAVVKRSRNLIAPSPVPALWGEECSLLPSSLSGDNGHESLGLSAQSF